MTAEDIVKLLGLEPLEPEGGWFAETYRAKSRVAAPSGADDGADRALATAIYYLITPETFSAMHRVRSDEIFHFYLGDPVEQLHLLPDGTGRRVTLGSDLRAGQRPQVVVPAGVWQGARLASGGSWALLGTTVAPGFEYADYDHGERELLVARYPEFMELIEALTPR